jgi:tetratricopeptide (TPR) repeat protein
MGQKTPSKDQVELPPAEAARVCRATAAALEKAGKDPEAIALYEKARKSDPAMEGVCRRLAVLYDRQGDFTKALEEYQRALKLNPHDADLLNDLGYAYYCRGRWTDAENSLRQAVEINPKHGRAWINLGMTLGQEERYTESFEAFAKVVSPAQAHCNVAFALTTQGKREEAKEAYRKALALNPDLRIARLALAKLEKSATRTGPAVGLADSPPKGAGYSVGTVQWDEPPRETAVQTTQSGSQTDRSLDWHQAGT